MAMRTWVFQRPFVLRRLGGHLYFGVGRPICSWRLGNQLGAVLTKYTVVYSMCGGIEQFKQEGFPIGKQRIRLF